MKSFTDYLSRFSWYRNSFGNKVFGFIENKISHKKYWVCLGKRKYRFSELISLYKYDSSKERLIDVDGRAWFIAFFCSNCGNELIYSNSFIGEYNTPNGGVSEYCCAHCFTKQYGNLDIIPGILHCNSQGVPNN